MHKLGWLPLCLATAACSSTKTPSAAVGAQPRTISAPRAMEKAGPCTIEGCIVLALTDRLVPQGGPEVALVETTIDSTIHYQLALAQGDRRWRALSLFSFMPNEGTGGGDAIDVRLHRVDLVPTDGMLTVTLDVDHIAYWKGGTGGIDDHLHRERFERAGQTVTAILQVGAPRVLLLLPTTLRIYSTRSDDYPAPEQPREVVELEVVARGGIVDVRRARGVVPQELVPFLGSHDLAVEPLVHRAFPLTDARFNRSCAPVCRRWVSR